LAAVQAAIEEFAGGWSNWVQRVEASGRSAGPIRAAPNSGRSSLARAT
jgi:hypothetical protein